MWYYSDLSIRHLKKTRVTTVVIKTLCLASCIIYNFTVIWKSNLTDKMKRSFFQAAAVLILLYGCTTWTLTKRLEKKLDGNYTRMLWAILNKSRRQHLTKHQLYGHLPLIMKTIQVRRTRHAGHCWRSKEELISDVLLWDPLTREDMGCSPEDLTETMNDREKWRERESQGYQCLWHDMMMMMIWHVQRKKLISIPHIIFLKTLIDLGCFADKNKHISVHSVVLY